MVTVSPMPARSQHDMLSQNPLHPSPVNGDKGSMLEKEKKKNGFKKLFIFNDSSLLTVHALDYCYQNRHTHTVSIHVKMRKKKKKR